MANRRIEFNDEEDSPYAEALGALAHYRHYEQTGDLALAATLADNAASYTQLLADEALLAASESTSERTLANMLMVPRPTLQYRIKRARNRVNGTDEEGEEQ